MGVYGSKVCGKIAVLFIAMLAGYIAKKTKLFDEKASNTLSSLLAYITNPCLIITSLQTECEMSVLVTAVKVLGMSVAIHAVLAVLCGFAAHRRSKKTVSASPDRAVYAFGFMYMNCGFMGFPIMQAMFPEHGLFFGVIYNIPFNLFVWTHGVALMSGSKGQKPDWKKILLNPGILSTVLACVLFVTGVRFPAVINDGLDMVGGMTFPLSMMIIGSLLGGICLRSLFTDIKLLAFSLAKMVAVPLVMLGVCMVCGPWMDFTLAAVCVTMCATPTAAVTAVFAEVYGANASLAAKIVGMTTLFSLVTMPMILTLAENLLK
ncbi:MAG: AEC family transporter [Eubacteriales bacterium]